MPFDSDFTSQLDTLLTPYRAQAQQLNNPYATMSQNSWLVQNHPEIAGHLDNAFLTAAMTPGPRGPEGVGGGISRAFEGLLGAQQFRRQRMLEAAMLPYQMLQPRLQAEHTMAQIGQEQAASDYYRAHGQYLAGMLDVRNNPKSVQGLKTDDKGNDWQEIFDPQKGTSRLFNPTTQQFADQLKSEDQPSFAKSIRQKTANEFGGGLMANIIAMQMDSDPAVRERGQAAGKIFTTMTGQMAGARTGGEQDAPHPYADQKSFIDNQRKAVYSKLETTDKFKDWKEKNDPYGIGDIAAPGQQTPNAIAYKQYQDAKTVEKQKLDFNWAQYERWAGKNPGKSWEESPWGSQSNTPTPVASSPAGPTGPKNSGKNWTPQ